MLRSTLLAAVVIAGVFAALGKSACDAEEPAVVKRPNILFLFADDWGCIASSYAAVDGAGGLHDIVRTPNFDRFARDGVLFRHAFVNAPSCTPCRSSLLSGQHFWRTGRGAILQGAVWDEKIPAWPLLLHDRGYHIGKIVQGVEPRHAGRCAVRRAKVRLSKVWRASQSVFAERHQAGRWRKIDRRREGGNSRRSAGQLCELSRGPSAGLRRSAFGSGRRTSIARGCADRAKRCGALSLMI